MPGRCAIQALRRRHGEPPAPLARGMVRGREGERWGTG